MSTLAVLPVKSFARAKRRIRGALAAPEGRAALAEAMVGDVLDALGRVPGLDGVVVVTEEPRAAALARAAGARVVGDPAAPGHSPAAARGVAEAVARGARRVLLVPGDCPALDPAEVAGLLAEHPGGRAVSVVPDRHGGGTNALVLAPGDVVAPAFGPGSLARHARLAHAAGARVAVRDVVSLGLDVDTPADLAALRGHLAGGEDGRAPRTRRALGGLRLAPAGSLA